MSVVWLFAIAYAAAWPFGLRVLRGLRRRSSLVITAFTGAAVGLANFALPGMLHDSLLADSPIVSTLLVFVLRALAHSLALIGFYDRERGRGRRRNEGRWRVLLVGGIFFAAVGLGLEGIVQLSGHWETTDLMVAPSEFEQYLP